MVKKAAHQQIISARKESGQKIKLNLGSGKDVRPGYINLDIAPLPGVDVVHDIEKFPYPFEDNAFDEIVAEHILVLVNDLIKVMEELHRISKPNGLIKVKVSHYHYHGSFQDPLTKRHFTMESFDYFTRRSLFKYYTNAEYEVVKKQVIPTLGGKFIPPRLRNFVGMIFGELCKEIYFELKVIK